MELLRYLNNNILNVMAMPVSPNQNKHDTNECGHNLVGVTDKVFRQ